MTTYYSLPGDGGPAQAMRELLRQTLESGACDMVLATAANPNGPVPMPALIAHADQVANSAPLAPAAMINSGAAAAKALRGDNGHSLLAVLKPCERRALVELAKLRQCSLDTAIVLSMDCMGRMERKDYLQTLGDAGVDGDSSVDDALTERYLQQDELQHKAAVTCQSCDAFTPEGADIALLLLGAKPVLAAQTEKGEAFCQQLGLSKAQEPKDRDAALKSLQERRAQAKEKLLAGTKERAGDMAGLQKVLASCIACHNCRVACPVCYCRECVFTSDVYRHDGLRYFKRASKKGLLRLPSDTTMYHLTRMTHMAHACVGCGQCSSVCPSDIPVADLFRMTAAAVQKLYDYTPGRSVDEPIPYLAFEQAAGEKGE